VGGVCSVLIGHPFDLGTYIMSLLQIVPHVVVPTNSYPNCERTTPYTVYAACVLFHIPQSRSVSKPPVARTNQYRHEKELLPLYLTLFDRKVWVACTVGCRHLS
jgi:hypothetical protein